MNCTITANVFRSTVFTHFYDQKFVMVCCKQEAKQANNSLNVDKSLACVALSSGLQSPAVLPCAVEGGPGFVRGLSFG